MINLKQLNNHLFSELNKKDQEEINNIYEVFFDYIKRTQTKLANKNGAYSTLTTEQKRDFLILLKENLKLNPSLFSDTKKSPKFGKIYTTENENSFYLLSIDYSFIEKYLITVKTESDNQNISFIKELNNISDQKYKYFLNSGSVTTGTTFGALRLSLESYDLDYYGSESDLSSIFVQSNLFYKYLNEKMIVNFINNIANIDVDNFISENIQSVIDLNALNNDINININLEAYKNLLNAIQQKYIGAIENKNIIKNKNSFISK